MGAGEATRQQEGGGGASEVLPLKIGDGRSCSLAQKEWVGGFTTRFETILKLGT